MWTKSGVLENNAPSSSAGGAHAHRDRTGLRADHKEREEGQKLQIGRDWERSRKEPTEGKM